MKDNFYKSGKLFYTKVNLAIYMFSENNQKLIAAFRVKTLTRTIK